MANYANAKATIAANVYQNNNQEVTADMVKAAINGVVSSLINGGYLYKGIATPTSPGTAQTPDERAFYVAITPGTYTYLGGIVVNNGEVAILKWDTAWSKDVVGSFLDAIDQYSIGMPSNGYILASDGSTTTHVTWKHSNFIPVKEGQSFSVFARISDETTLRAAFYDKELNYDTTSPLAGADAANTMKYYDFTIPAGVAYIRVHSAYAAGTDPRLPYLLLNGKIVDLFLQDDEIGYTSLLFPNLGFINPDGTFIEVSTGRWLTTDFITVLPGVAFYAYLYATTGANCPVAFYDENKSFIAASSIVAVVTGFAPYKGVVPPGAAYMRCCTYDQYVSSSYCKIYGPNSLDNAIGGYVQKYHDNLQKPYSFNGKTITFFGDSITKGVASDGGVLSVITNCYAKLLCDKLGATLDNHGVSGSRFVGTGGGTPPVQSITSNILSFVGTTDVIWIAGGTNDYQLQSPIGDESDTTEVSMYGALYLICEFLKTYYPTATIIFATPINWSREVNNHPITIEKYRDVIFEMATKYGYSVVDCSEIGFPAEQTGYGVPDYKAAVIYDGVHPTVLGHAIMANNLASKVL